MDAMITEFITGTIKGIFALVWLAFIAAVFIRVFCWAFGI